MRTETLERLVIDRASGELSSDAAELLEGYLAEDPQARATATEIEQTIALAKQALPSPTQAPLPKPRIVALAPARQGNALVWSRRAATMAACLAVGLALGYFISSPAPSTAPAQVLAKREPPAVGAAVGTTETKPHEARTPFLHAPRQRTARASSARSQLIWKVLFKNPETQS